MGNRAIELHNSRLLQLYLSKLYLVRIFGSLYLYFCNLIDNTLNPFLHEFIVGIQMLSCYSFLSQNVIYNRPQNEQPPPKLFLSLYHIPVIYTFTRSSTFAGNFYDISRPNVKILQTFIA